MAAQIDRVNAMEYGIRGGPGPVQRSLEVTGGSREWGEGEGEGEAWGREPVGDGVTSHQDV